MLISGGCAALRCSRREAEEDVNEVRAVTNLIGNGVATIAVAKWDGAFDRQQAREVMLPHREGRSTAIDDVLQNNEPPATTH